MAVVGTIIQATGQLLSGIAQGNAAHYQARVATNNAIIERQNAAAAAQATSSNIEQASLKASSQESQLEAGTAANNIDVGSGSAANVLTSQREIGNLNTGNIGHQGALQVYGYESQAVNYQAQSKIDAEEGDFDYLGGVLNAAGTVANNWDVIGGGGGGGGSGGGGAQEFSPGATGMPQSLMSGSPSVPDEYAWMQESSSPGTGVIY